MVRWSNAVWGHASNHPSIPNGKIHQPVWYMLIWLWVWPWWLLSSLLFFCFYVVAENTVNGSSSFFCSCSFFSQVTSHEHAVGWRSRLLTWWTACACALLAGWHAWVLMGLSKSCPFVPLYYCISPPPCIYFARAVNSFSPVVLNSRSQIFGHSWFLGELGVHKLSVIAMQKELRQNL